MAGTTSPYGPVYTCRARDEALVEALAAAIGRLPRAIHQAEASKPGRPTDAARLKIGTAAQGPTVKESSYVVVENALMQVIDGTPQPVAAKSGKGTDGIFAKHARIIRQMIPVRDALRDLLRAQVENQPWGAAQMRLGVA
jgi:N12 class adenine-specific DNA methylase